MYFNSKRIIISTNYLLIAQRRLNSGLNFANHMCRIIIPRHAQYTHNIKNNFIFLASGSLLPALSNNQINDNRSPHQCFKIFTADVISPKPQKMMISTIMAKLSIESFK